jgi:hypothetical protein
MRTAFAAAQYLGILAVCCSSAPAQTPPPSYSWVYVAATVTDGRFSAVAVAGTEGAAAHTIAKIAVSVRSPRGRTASADDLPMSTPAKVTAYLSLCGGGVCEDGEFSATAADTAARHGQWGGTLDLPARPVVENVRPWIKWIAASAVPGEISRSDGSAKFTGTLLRSGGCGGAAASFEHSGPSGMLASSAPPSPQEATFAGMTGTVVWTFHTAAANAAAGRVALASRIETTACDADGPASTGATLGVIPD